ncbi:ferredoxin FdxA [Rhodococcus opacus]|uniref:ferredoxin FdxA n=1 Tax=Rhodococcus opacus TaxID=37919 RepID=UPI000EAA66F9|nr:ferredoxin FdxA [Rhodococcus opacus]QZS52598.1 ferredoxin family protein [Rhodococcus opacus]RKM64858.1 ferredoxin [Rhodococcus opacus]
MTFVVTEDCIKCKYTDCVDVCPVPTCFHEGDNMLVIDPAVCIDCGICEPACPVDAILPDSYEEAEVWVDLNRDYASKWPAILKSKPAPTDAEDFRDVSDKFAQHFSPLPAQGA